MYDVQVEIRKGEKGPEYGKITVPTGSTVTISSVTFQLLNADHTPVNNSGSGGTDFTSAQTATSEAGSGTSKQVWYILSDTDTNLLVAGSWYIGRFVITPTVTDSNPRKKVIEVQIVVTW